MHFVFLADDSLAKSGPAGLAQSQARDTHESVLILYREQSDLTFTKDKFGEGLLGMAPVAINDPSDAKDFLSCVIFVDAKTLQDELQKRSHSTPYEDLLRTARKKVGKDVLFLVKYAMYCTLCIMIKRARLGTLLLDKPALTNKGCG